MLSRTYRDEFKKNDDDIVSRILEAEEELESLIDEMCSEREEQDYGYEPLPWEHEGEEVQDNIRSIFDDIDE